MKFLAILKDSFREAIDGKIFFVMLGLSGLLALLVFSISYTPLPAQEALHEYRKQGLMAVVAANQGDSPKTRMFAVSASVVGDVQTIQPGPTPPEGAYRFTLDVKDESRLGMVGAEIEGKGKSAKVIKAEGGMFGRGALREAVAYWFSVPGGQEVKASELTDAQVEGFVAAQLDRAGLPTSSVRKKPTEERGVERFEVETKPGASLLAWPHRVTPLFGAIRGFVPPWPSSLGMTLFLIEGFLVNGLGGWVALMVAVAITAGFIPNMLRKGSVDLLLSKPIGRAQLLVYKYLGGLTFILLTATVAVGGVWLAVGLRTGFWGVGFLGCILALTFYFSILYAISTLVAVLTRNTVVAIVVTFACWLGLSVTGGIHAWLLSEREKEVAVQRAAEGEGGEADPAGPRVERGEDKFPDWAYQLSDLLNTITPRTSDLDNLTSRLISRDLMTETGLRQSQMHLVDRMKWSEVLGVSGAWIALFLGLACWRFSRRDH